MSPTHPTESAVEMTKRVPLPEEFIPFILEHLSSFDAALEDGERIVLTFKSNVIAQARAMAATPPRQVPPTPPKTMLRPKFVYKVQDRKLTPMQAKRYGFSEPRLKVYQAVYDANARGIQAKDIMTKTGLAHGSVQQILHWLRRQEMVVGEPE